MATLRYCLGDMYGRIGYGEPVGKLYTDEATARAVAAEIPAERRRYGVYLYTTDDLRNHLDGTELYPPMPRDELVALIERERRDELAAFRKERG